jgi:hypothetical protein
MIGGCVVPNVRYTGNTTVVSDTGEVLYSEQHTSYRVPDEPPYVKMYLDTILYLKDLPKAYNPVLLAILRRMPWANAEQGMAINGSLKRLMSAETGYSVSRINDAITDFVKGELLYRIDKGLYGINAHLFGRGEWRDIEQLRMTIDFDAQGKTVNGEIKKKTKMIGGAINGGNQ